ncbi:FecR family protein [Abyssalbus ytuae]|uniref:DUF4974 domain-containing protein n=1 Tax=Abyssalbus ytuae TaxID=2926907 RepID=A0A9E7CYI1_9FLAO|nr:FecR domain-containing protein [Abyssalbus ytuae]UOB16675.1 DUF4974 domain-containing protein [Abyssalbus ytuae]
MKHFNEIIEYSKKISKAVLKRKNMQKVERPDAVNEEDGKYVLNKLNNGSYWDEHNILLQQIDTKKEWKKLEKKISVTGGKWFSYVKYAAAAVVIGVGLTVLYNTIKEEQHTPVQIVAGSDRAILSLEDGKQIELFEDLSFSNDYANVVKNSLVYTNDKGGSAALMYNYLTIPRGGKFTVELTDGTKVWLNSETKLKYPVRFLKGQTREVELLYGEAYFDVSHSDKHNGDAFRVITKDQNVEVLGTEFNIRAYPAENDIFTTLNTGSISINYAKENRIIKPGEQAVYNPATGDPLVVTPVDIEYQIAWKNGLFMFEKEPLGKMMTELSRWYNVEIVFENASKAGYRFSGVLRRDENIKNLLTRLEATKEVEFKIIGNKIIIK